MLRILILTSIVAAAASSLQAQPGYEPNVLGLPAVPQTKPGAGVPAPIAAQTAVAPPPDIRSFITGPMSIQHSAVGGVGRIAAVSQAIYKTSADRQMAIKAGEAMQSGVRAACGKQCQPLPMTKPYMTREGQVHIDIAFKPLYANLNHEQMVLLLQGKPVQLSQAQRTVLLAPVPPAK